jgi:hypothetical protein
LDPLTKAIVTDGLARELRAAVMEQNFVMRLINRGGGGLTEAPPTREPRVPPPAALRPEDRPAPPQEVRPMSRLADKLARAAGAAKRATEKIEARADAVIAKEGDLDRKADAAFAPHEAVLTDAEKGLDEVSRALSLLSNE